MNCLGYNKNPLPTVALVWLDTEIVSIDVDNNNSKAHIEAVSLGWTFQMTYRFTDNDNPAEAGLLSCYGNSVNSEFLGAI